MTKNIHKTAIIDEQAIIGENVTIGPYCTVGPHVTLEKDVTLISHSVVDGYTHIGEGTKIYPFASIGMETPDRKYKGEPSKLIIGKHNIIREHVTMNPGTEHGGMYTRVGDHNLFMVGVHIAHDCQIGSHIIMANNATLGGHVEVGDYANLGGLCAVQQFVRIGAYAMIGGMSGIDKDIIPYGIAYGERSYLEGLNIIGMKRRGIERNHIYALRQAYRQIFTENGQHFADRLHTIEKDFSDVPEVMTMLDFIRLDTSRSICIPKMVPQDDEQLA